MVKIQIETVDEGTPLVSTSKSSLSSFKREILHSDDESMNKRGAHEDVIPTWNEMFTEVMPYIWPIDFIHTLYAVLAFISVLVGKVIDIIPPLVIKHAVDLISHTTHASSSSQETKSTTVHPLILTILLYFALSLLSLLNSSGQDLAQRAVTLDAERRFGVYSFAHLQSLSLSYHLEKHVGEITRVLNRGVESVNTLISSFLFFVMPVIFETILVSAIFVHLGTPWITISTIASVIIYFFFTVAVTKTRVKNRRKVVEARDSVSSKETETLINYETVSMFGRTQYEVTQYAKLRQTYKDATFHMLFIFASLEMGQKFIRLSGISMGLIIAGYAAIQPGQTTMTPGSFVAIQIYINQLYEPLRMMGWQYRKLVSAFTDLEKAVTMLMRVSEVQDTPNAMIWKPQHNNKSTDSPHTKETSGEIIFQNVSFHYKMNSKHRSLGTCLDVPLKTGKKGKIDGRKRIAFPSYESKETQLNNKPTNKKEGKKWYEFWVSEKTNEKESIKNVDDKLSAMEHQKSDDNNEMNDKKSLGGVDEISFHVPAGTSAALVGASGSGKTTLIRLVLRLYDTDGGSVIVNGNNVKSITQQSLRENIGVVAQETVLFNASLRENIIYGKTDATDEDIWKAVRTAALDDFVKGLPNQLETLVGERGMKLSGGERQRVGMARCVIKDPQLILLDEATSALDSATERVIQKNIAELCVGRTTLMIAHRLSTARRCNQILVLDKGRIVEQGNHDELLQQKGKYANMWKIQTESSDD